MYSRGLGRMGDIDWTAILNTTVQTAGKTISSIENPAIGYGGYQIGTTGLTGATEGVGFGTIALLGIGIFFLLKVMKR